MICEKCGATIQDGLKFCTECGTRIGEKKKKFCGACGFEITGELKFCGNCGAKVTIAETEQPASVSVPKSLPQTTSAPQQTEKFCPKCGTTQKSTAKFCLRCGQSLDNLPAVNPNAQQHKTSAQCPKCGTIQKPEAKFCLRCGADMHSQNVSQQQRTAKPTKTAQAPQVPQAPKKKKSGKKVISLLTAAAIAFGITGFWKPGFLRDKYDYINYTDFNVQVPDGALPGSGQYTVTEIKGGIEIVSDDEETVMLSEPATISFRMEEPAQLADLYHYTVVYTYKGDRYYIEPDQDMLLQGVVQFQTNHFSNYTIEYMTDKELREKLAKQYATRDVTGKWVVEDKSDPKTKSCIYNGIYKIFRNYSDPLSKDGHRIAHNGTANSFKPSNAVLDCCADI